MSADRWIEHVTLTSGHSRRSLATEISPQALAVARSVIRHLPDDPAASIPLPGPLNRYRIGGPRHGKCITLHICPADAPEPVVSMAIAAHSICGSQAWRELHRYCDEWRLPYRTDPESCPSEPWVAALLDTAAPEHEEALPIIADFERCLAWAWLAHLKSLQ